MLLDRRVGLGEEPVRVLTEPVFNTGLKNRFEVNPLNIPVR